MHILIIKDNLVTYIDPLRFDADGVDTGRFSDPFTNYTNADCVAVKELPMYMAAGKWTYIDGQLSPLPEYEAATLPTARSGKLAEVNAAYTAAIAALTPTYPDDERFTFDKQEAEARAWLADNSAPTPFVDALAAGRHMDKAELVARIIAKADAFALASGSLTGQRQRYEDMLDAATTLTDVAAVVPVYALPDFGGGQE